MSKFIQLEQTWHDTHSGEKDTGMIIINLDMVMVANTDVRRVTLRPDLSYSLTERGWAVLMEAFNECNNKEVDNE